LPYWGVPFYNVVGYFDIRKGCVFMDNLVNGVFAPAEQTNEKVNNEDTIRKIMDLVDESCINVEFLKSCSRFLLDKLESISSPDKKCDSVSLELYAAKYNIDDYIVLECDALNKIYALDASIQRIWDLVKTINNEH